MRLLKRLCLVALLGFTAVSADEALSDQEVEMHLKKMIKGMKLPQNDGNGVHMTGAKVLPRGIAYYYSLSETAEELFSRVSKAEFKQEIYNINKNLYCTSKIGKFFKDNDVDLVTNYYSKDGILLASFDITDKDCSDKC
jgi:hypothetical protein